MKACAVWAGRNLSSKLAVQIAGTRLMLLDYTGMAPRFGLPQFTNIISQGNSTMHKFVIYGLIFASGFALSEQSDAQVRMSDVPSSFFGAQRGRIVAHPNGRFRIHYGRGLTSEGAGVLTNAIGTFGPLLPMIIGAAPNAPANDAPEPSNYVPEPMQDDPVLTPLANEANHKCHMDALTQIEDRMKVLLGKYEIEPAVAPDCQEDVSLPAPLPGDGSINPPNVTGGGRVNP